MKKLKIIIITGLSGSGKSTAIAALEDADFYCVDNMPVALLPKFLELPMESDTEIQGLAFVMDLREKGFLSAYPPVFDFLRTKGYDFDILFLEAEEETLLRRYSQTRRHHPLSQEKSVREGIRREWEQLRELREIATRIIDTTHYHVHNLKTVVLDYARKGISGKRMGILVMSFGFKFGVPQDADIVMDVRFLNNPYFVPQLKNLSGESQAIKDFVLSQDQAHRFLNKFLDMLDYMIPLYAKEGKSYLTIALGCTGGRHRSVAVADKVHRHLLRTGRQIDLKHRDIELQN